MRCFNRVLLATLAALALPAAQAAGNLVVNGSFEADPGPSGYWVITPTLTGWTGEPEIERQNNFENNTAQDGLYLVELDANFNSAMSQTITATGWVQLSFWYSARSNTAAGTNGLAYSLGSLTGTVLDSAAGAASTQWQQFSALVDLGNSASTTLRFAATGVSDQYGGLLDNVSVTAVPEPATTALWLAGAGALAAAGLRRRCRARRCRARR